MQTAKHPSCYHVGYSLSCSEYDDLLRLADGLCSICKNENPRPYIDHDHTLGTWAVRGLICHGCNQHLKCVDAGRRPVTPPVANYLANAWHERQGSSSIKQARVQPKVECPSCGRPTSVHSNGRLHRHWAASSGPKTAICSGAEPVPV